MFTCIEFIRIICYIITIPFHKGKELNKITENSIRKQAGIK
ncbi:type II toxin-antitoxin system HicA family toxin [Agathobacter sp.]